MFLLCFFLQPWHQDDFQKGPSQLLWLVTRLSGQDAGQPGAHLKSSLQGHEKRAGTMLAPGSQGEGASAQAPFFLASAFAGEDRAPHPLS